LVCCALKKNTKTPPPPPPPPPHTHTQVDCSGIKLELETKAREIYTALTDHIVRVARDQVSHVF
jgi:hypothetical protein